MIKKFKLYTFFYYFIIIFYYNDLHCCQKKKKININNIVLLLVAIIININDNNSQCPTLQHDGRYSTSSAIRVPSRSCVRYVNGLQYETLVGLSVFLLCTRV